MGRRKYKDPTKQCGCVAIVLTQDPAVAKQLVNALLDRKNESKAPLKAIQAVWRSRRIIFELRGIGLEKKDNMKTVPVYRLAMRTSRLFCSSLATTRSCMPLTRTCPRSLMPWIFQNQFDYIVVVPWLYMVYLQQNFDAAHELVKIKKQPNKKKQTERTCSRTTSV